MKKLIIISLVLFLMKPAFSQDTLSKLSFYFVPQNLITSGLRFDLEKLFVKKSPQSLCASFLFFADSKNEEDTYYYYDAYDSKLTWGYGLEIHHKLFIQSRIENLSGYLGYGALYRQHGYTYTIAGWENQLVDGLSTLQYKPVDYNMNIYRFGANLIMGMNLEIFYDFLIDVYAGAGIRYSSRSGQINNDVLSYDWVFTHDYTGITPVLGFRIGKKL